mgnify:FL=1
MKIVYMGTPAFAVPALKAIFDKGFQIPLVISQMDKPKGRGNKLQPTPVKELAINLGLTVHQPENVNDSETIDMLKSIEPDFIIVAAYGQILKEELLKIPKYDCLNIHASILPRYRGAAPINWAVINGDSISGVTIMKMEKGLDTGPIVLMAETQIDDEDTAEELHDRLSVLGAELIVRAIDDIIKGEAAYIPQDHGESSYAPMLYKNTGRIDWSKPSDKIRNMIRGLIPWPNAFSFYKGERVRILKADSIKQNHNIPPGTIVKADKDGIKVAAGDGFVIIKELQFPNKKPMEVSAFLLGNKIEEGYVL